MFDKNQVMTCNFMFLLQYDKKIYKCSYRKAFLIIALILLFLALFFTKAASQNLVNFDTVLNDNSNHLELGELFKK